MTEALARSLEAEADAAAARRALPEAERLLTRALVLDATAPERFIKLSAVRRGQGNLEGALTAIADALARDPLDFMPLLMRAGLLQALGRGDEAAEAYQAALFHAPPDAALPPSVRGEMARARQIAGAYTAARSAQLAHAAALATLGAAEAAQVARFVSNIVRSTTPYPQAPTHFHYPGMAPIEFHPRDAFPFLAKLEAETETIAAEFAALVSSEAAALTPYIHYPDDMPLAQWAVLNRSEAWSALHLWQLGERVETNARHCPRTMALFDAIDQPRIPGRGPNLMFSLLAPRTRIPPHTGVANTRLVLHLPLIVPPNCGFRVGAETRAWRRGEAFVFDDTIEHEAWNDSDELRVVLIGDLWQPALSSGERDAVGAIIAASAGPAVL